MDIVQWFKSRWDNLPMNIIIFLYYIHEYRIENSVLGYAIPYNQGIGYTTVWPIDIFFSKKIYQTLCSNHSLIYIIILCLFKNEYASGLKFELFKIKKKKSKSEYSISFAFVLPFVI